MKVTCQSCAAQYQLPDDKVRGRKAKVRCKKCSQAILVDGTALVSATAPPTATTPPNAAGTSEAPPASEPAAPIEAVPVEAAPSDAAPIEAAPSDAAPVEAAPSDAAPSDAAPSEAAPVEAAPVDAAPVEAAPSDVVPIAAAPSAVPSPASGAPTAALSSASPTATGLDASPVHVDPAARWDDDDEATRVMTAHDEVPASSQPQSAPASSVPRPAVVQVESGTPAGSASAPAASRPTAPPPSPGRRTQPPPLTARSSRPSAPRATAPSPATTLLAGSGSPQAARRADAPSQDLFAQRAPEVSPEPEPRHPNSENSVLFSLEALKAASSPAVPEKRPTPPPEDFLALGGGADLDAAAMPLIQVEPTQPELTGAASFRRSGTARGMWLALAGIAAVGLGSYFGVQAYMARAGGAAPSDQAQVHAPLSGAPAAVAANLKPTHVAGSDEPSAREEAPHPGADSEDEATELDALPKLDSPRPSVAKGASPRAERTPAAGHARQAEAPRADRAASPPVRSPKTEPSDTVAASSRATENVTSEAASAPTPEAEAAAPERGASEESETPGDVTADTASAESPAAADSAQSTAPAATEEALVAFNVDAARSALESAAASAKSCKAADGPMGTGRVLVTFAVSGRVTSARVEGPPFAGTTVGGCIARAFRSASVPAFSGSPQTVAKSFTIQ